MAATAQAIAATTILLLTVGSLPDQIHEFIELWSDDNLRAAVALLAELRIVGGNGVILATTASRQSLGVYTIVVLQGLNH